MYFLANVKETNLLVFDHFISAKVKPWLCCCLSVVNFEGQRVVVNQNNLIKLSLILLQLL